MSKVKSGWGTRTPNPHRTPGSSPVPANLPRGGGRRDGGGPGEGAADCENVENRECLTCKAPDVAECLIHGCTEARRLREAKTVAAAQFEKLVTVDRSPEYSQLPSNPSFTKARIAAELVRQCARQLGELATPMLAIEQPACAEEMASLLAGMFDFARSVDEAEARRVARAV